MFNFKSITAVITFSALALALTGCVEYKNALCNESNRADIPGFAGTKVIRLVGDDGVIKEESIEIVSVGEGLYQTGDGQSTSCQVASGWVLESVNDRGHYSSVIVEVLGRDGFHLSFPVIDKEVLDAAGISYELIDTSNNSSESMDALGFTGLSVLNEADEGSILGSLGEALLVHNLTEEDTEVLRSSLKASSFGFSLR